MNIIMGSRRLYSISSGAIVSKEEAVYFLTRVLGISSPLEKVAQDRFLFLKEFIPEFQMKIPFQSISLLSTEPYLRRRPNVADIKMAVMSGKGGVCYPLTTFTKLLLETLGYDINFCAADIYAPTSHTLTIVHNLKKPGDKHLVDVGMGCPCFEPLPLDFEDESPVYKQSYTEFKYARKDGELVRYHKSSKYNDLAPDFAQEDEIGWKRCYSLDEKIISREWSFFDEPIDKLYTDLDCVYSPFHQSLRAIAYHREGADLRLVAIKDSSLLLENESHHIEEQKLGSVEEVLEKVDLYFPLLSAEARVAVKNIKWDF